MTPALVRALIAGNQSRSGTATVLAWVAPGGGLWLAPLGTPAPDRGEPMPADWVRVDVAAARSDIAAPSARRRSLTGADVPICADAQASRRPDPTPDRRDQGRG